MLTQTGGDIVGVWLTGRCRYRCFVALDTSVRDAPRRLLEHRRHLVREFAAGGVESPGFFRSEFRSWYQNRNITSFLKPLITSSALVFDIGANQGVWTKAFRDRDATVVAVEPQATCCLALEREFSGDRRVRIVSKAVGSQEGEAVLYSDVPGMEQASMAPDWMDDLRGAQVMPAHAWGGAGKLVPVTTLDALIAAFGRPEYCKIDVEGSEPEVLGGLSQAIPALSFEFHRA